MSIQPFAISAFPRAILHIDGDAFFASCEQSRNPNLKGKPVITGKERGIAASLSYEAKAQGVTRGMRLSEIKKLCPKAVIVPSDYETYSLLSLRFYAIVRRYTPEVEEYSIDECFADLTGLQRPLRMNYHQIAQKIQNDLQTELGFTFSIGLAPNKVIAKIASKWQKPAGLTIIPGKRIHHYLENLPLEKIWGVGPQTTAYLQKQRVLTALQFAQKSEDWIKMHFSKPFYEIWQELNGQFVLKLDTNTKQSYSSIQKVKTFTPPSNNSNFIFAQLCKNIENACIKARRYQLVARGAIFFVKTQAFDLRGVKIKFSRPTAFPNEIIKALRPIFLKIYQPRTKYRATGVVLLDLTKNLSLQPDLFGESLSIEKTTSLYQSIDKIAQKYGKHTLHLGSSHLAHIKGEIFRKRLAIPMLIGRVS